MRVTINSVGDPWRDWGIISAYKMFKTLSFTCSQVIAAPELNSYSLSIEFIDKSNLSQIIVEGIKNYLQDLLNQIVLRDSAMKALEIERPKDHAGFHDPRFVFTLREEDIAIIQEKTGLKPNGKTAGVTLKRNYIGIVPDWEKAKTELDNLVNNFCEHISTSTMDKGKAYCPVCGLAYPKKLGVAMRQNKNPFYNQHHNNKVRGHANSVDTMDMCPTCNFLNSLASYTANLPYFISDCTNLILPEITNLIVLDKIYDNFSKLINLEDANSYSMVTNIHGLRHRSLYPVLITLYQNIKYKYSADKNEFTDEITWDDELNPYLHRWHIIRYKKGKNVIFNAFSTIDIPHRLFDLVSKSEYGKEKDKKGDLVETFLNLWPTTDRNLDDLAQGIVLKNWSLVAKALFYHYRNQGELYFKSISFLETFVINAIGEVDCLLKHETIEDIKTIANCMGSVLKDDIGLFTNLYNAHNADALRKVLSQVFFKMNKIQQTNKDSDINIFIPKDIRVERFLNELTKENFSEIKDTLIIFASLNALRNSRQEKKNEKEDEN